MNIWIVDDDKGDALRAFEAIERVVGRDHAVFWDSNLLWSGELSKMPLREGDLPVSKLDHMPDIVILDLLDGDGCFAAGKFYEKLRNEEAQNEEVQNKEVRRQLQPSFVIVWSVKTGLEEVYKFLDAKARVDRRLAFTNSKSTTALDSALKHCVSAWQEAQHL